MITVKDNSDSHEFETLDQAMAWAKELGEFVTIWLDGMKVIGKFETEGILNGNFSTGEVCTWKNAASGNPAFKRLYELI
jgi:hypothetical protein